MKKYSVIIIVLLLISLKTTAELQESDILSKQLQEGNIESPIDYDRMSAYEKEIQILNKRTELLEHDISEIKIKLLELTSNKQPVEQKTLSNKNLDNSSVNQEKLSKPKTENISLAQDKQQYDLALSMLKEEKFEQSEKIFSNFIIKYPNSELQSNARFWYAETFYRRNQFEQAALNYLKGYKFFPKGNKAADSLLKLSISLEKIGKTKNACEMVNKLEKEFPIRSTSSIERTQEIKRKCKCN